MIVAIDGPAGSGKSTVARTLAEKLGWTYLDSGAMYRATAHLMMKKGGSAAERARELKIELGERVVVNGKDVSAAIRTPEVAETASRIAGDKQVRDALVQKQRDLLQDGHWVAEGRDIGTVVAPSAELKIFLTASPEERARRRADELGVDWRSVLKEQAIRDEQDRTREHSPLMAAADAIELDTTERTIEDVVGQVLDLVRGLKKK